MKSSLLLSYSGVGTIVLQAVAQASCPVALPIKYIIIISPPPAPPPPPKKKEEQGEIEGGREGKEKNKEKKRNRTSLTVLGWRCGLHLLTSVGREAFISVLLHGFLHSLLLHNLLPTPAGPTSRPC